MNLPHNHNEDAAACQFLQEKIGDVENFPHYPNNAT